MDPRVRPVRAVPHQQPRAALPESDGEECFASVVGALADGALVLPAPFDPASSLALARNEHTGATALDMFDAEQRRTVPRYRIQITEICGDEDDGVEREMIHTVATPRAAVHLLGSSADLIIAEAQRTRKGNTAHGEEND